jgi:hypothetical protein
MEARRLDLGLTWEQVADRASLRYETIRAIRAGESRGRALSRRAISAALAWTAGSVDSILDGGDPEEAAAAPLQTPAATEDAERRAVIDGVRALYPGDRVAESILTQWHKPLEQRQRELDAVRRATATGAAEALAHVNRNEEGTITPFW